MVVRSRAECGLEGSGFIAALSDRLPKAFLTPNRSLPHPYNVALIALRTDAMDVDYVQRLTTEVVTVQETE